MAEKKQKLGELLVEYKAISIPQLKQALRNQGVYGGRLGTNLVEMGFLTTTQIAAVLAKQLGITATRPADFDNIPNDVLKLIPKDFSVDHLVFPIKKSADKVTVAFCNPLDFQVRDELAFRMGCKIDVRVAPEVLIHHALERYHDAVIPRHAIDIEEVAKNESVDIKNVIVRDASDLESESIISSEEEAKLSKRHYGMKELCIDLFAVRNANEVFDSFWKFIAADISHAAVLMLRKQEIWGWWQKGFPIQTNHFRDHLLNIFDISSVSRVFRERLHDPAPEWTDIDENFLSRMGADIHFKWQLFPLILAGRVIVVFLGGERGLGKMDAMAIDDGLMRASLGLQIVSLRQKLFTDIEG